MKRNKQRYLVSGIAALAVVTSAIGGYAWYQKPARAPAGPTVEVKRGSLTETAAASGKIEPHVQVEVKSRVSGQVTEVLVQDGDHVDAGQLLVKLDPADAQRALASAKVARDRVKAEVAASQASVAVADLERKNDQASEELAKKSADLGLGTAEAARAASHATQVAGANLTAKRAQVGSAQAQLKAAELAVQDAETQVTQTTIYAPVAGTVLGVVVEKGTLVSSALTNVSGGSAMMTIADLSDLRVVGAIDEAQIARVAPGQQVDIRVDTYADRVFHGVVDRVSPLGKDTSSIVTFDVEIAVQDEHASLLRSGMSADVEIVTAEQKDVLLVPLVAVQSAGNRRFVRLASGEERTIATGATDGSRMVVMKGLEEGDAVLQSAPPAASASADAKAGQQKQSSQNPMRGMGMGAPQGRGR